VEAGLFVVDISREGSQFVLPGSREAVLRSHSPCAAAEGSALPG